MTLDIDQWDAPNGFTQAQWELTRLQFIEPGKGRPGDRTLRATRLVEFRCRGSKVSGHLLAVIYRTRRGPLAVSTADELHDAERMAGKRRHGQALIDGFGAQRQWNPKRPNWDPSPKLIEFVEAFVDDAMPLNCRCQRWPGLTREHLRLSLARHISSGANAARPSVVGVSTTGLHSARDTLCMF